MEDGNDDETLARISGDDWQRCIHGRGSTYTDRCQFAEVFCQQRSHDRVRISRQMLARRAMVPSSAPRYSVMKILERVISNPEPIAGQSVSWRWLKMRDSAAQPANVPRMVITGSIIRRGFTFLKLFSTEVSQPMLIPTQNIRRQVHNSSRRYPEDLPESHHTAYDDTQNKKLTIIKLPFMPCLLSRFQRGRRFSLLCCNILPQCPSKECTTQTAS